MVMGCCYKRGVRIFVEIDMICLSGVAMVWKWIKYHDREESAGLIRNLRQAYMEKLKWNRLTFLMGTSILLHHAIFNCPDDILNFRLDR